MRHDRRRWKDPNNENDAITKRIPTSRKSGFEDCGHPVASYDIGHWNRCSCATVSMAQKDPVDWVNLYIGTGSGQIGYGGTMPFVTPPFGMTDWTPQTRQNKISVVSYQYEDTTISGFMGTHQPEIVVSSY